MSSALTLCKTFTEALALADGSVFCIEARQPYSHPQLKSTAYHTYVYYFNTGHRESRHALAVVQTLLDRAEMEYTATNLTQEWNAGCAYSLRLYGDLMSHGVQASVVVALLFFCVVVFGGFIASDAQSELFTLFLGLSVGLAVLVGLGNKHRIQAIALARRNRQQFHRKHPTAAGKGFM